MASPSLPSTPGTPQIVVQTPEGQNINLQNRFPQGTQFFVPQNIQGNNKLTYMVVTKENVVSSMHVPVNTGSDMKSHTTLTSPPTGVSQMMANVSKTSLVSDIDDPTKISSHNTSGISIVKGTGPPTQQILIKRSNYADSNDRQVYNISADDQSSVIHPRIPDHASTRSRSSPISSAPPSYHDATRQLHYPRVQSVNSYGEPNYSPHEQHPRPLVQTADKHQQIHVHKVHHGNARVKYVEFKPVQDGSQEKQHGGGGMKLPHAGNIQSPHIGPLQSPHGYNQNIKQNFGYPNHIPVNQSAPHLSVHTPGQAPKSPLHSPPALRPPPSLPSRSAVRHSPPSLMPSPEVQPRFDFYNNTVSTTTTNAAINHSPVQVANMMYPKMIQPPPGGTQPQQSGAALNIVGNQAVNLPRLPGNYQMNSPGYQNNQLNIIPRNKGVFQNVRPPDSNLQHDMQQPRSSQVATSSLAGECFCCCLTENVVVLTEYKLTTISLHMVVHI